MDQTFDARDCIRKRAEAHVTGARKFHGSQDLRRAAARCLARSADAVRNDVRGRRTNHVGKDFACQPRVRRDVRLQRWRSHRHAAMDLCIDRHHRAPNEVSGMPVVRSNQTTSGEVVLFRTDGEPVSCLVQARPIQAQEPALEVLREAIYTFQNISEIKRQREALSRSLLELKEQGEELQSALAQQQLIFDTALVGLLFVRDSRPGGQLRDGGPARLRAWCPGVSDAVVFTSDRPLAAGQFVRALPAHQRHWRHRVRAAYVPAQGAADLGRRSGPRGNPERPELGYIFAFVNVDERKRSERELRATLSELQLIFDNALVAVLYVANDLIVKANVATQQLFGYDARDWDELQMSSLFAAPGDWADIRELPLAEVDSEESAEKAEAEAEPEPSQPAACLSSA